MIMSPSAGFQFSLYFLQTKKVLWKLTGLCYILLFTLCFFADQGYGKVSPPGIWKRADVTFDSNTAFKSLVVLPNKKTVKNVGVPHVVPDNPERFNSSPCVLGSPGFRSGKHFFKVKYGTQREWAVGLAGKSVKRKGNLNLVPEERIWQTGLWWLRHLETDHSTSGKIVVFVDYNAGNVIFDLNSNIWRVLGGGPSLLWRPPSGTNCPLKSAFPPLSRPSGRI